MRKIFLKTKKYTSVFAIQFLELSLVTLFLILSFIIAGALIYTNPFPFGTFNGLLLFLSATAVTLIILATNKYFHFMDTSFTKIVGKTTYSVIILNLILIVLLYFIDIMRLSPYYFIAAGSFQIMFLFIVKIFSGMLKRNLFKNKITLIIGKGEEKSRLLNLLRKQYEINLTFVSEEDEKLKEYVDRADNIYLVESQKLKIKEEVIGYCELMNKRIFIVPEVHEIAMRNSETYQIGDVPLFAIEGFKLTEAQILVKRLVDIILSLGGIIMTSPIVIAAAFFIKTEDGGPIFYKQLRTGVNGKEFNLIKLRSMAVDAEKYTGAIFASENDQRITKTGNFIRMTRIDEIPQFFNVLCGSMSIVGPRPERPVFVDAFSRQFPEYVHRLAVKPGITGLAQVMANYTTTAENKLKFDLIYIKEYSPLLDIKILFKTVKVIFTKEQAVGFSEKKEDSDFDLADEISPEDFFESINKSKLHIKAKKRNVIFTLCCFIIIIIASTLLRYSTLSITMLEIITSPVQIETGVMAENDLKTGISQKEVKAFLENMTYRQKALVSYELIKRLEAKDLLAIDTIVEDGISKDEIKNVQKIMSEKFDTAELNKLNKLVRDD